MAMTATVTRVDTLSIHYSEHDYDPYNNKGSVSYDTDSYKLYGSQTKTLE